MRELLLSYRDVALGYGRRKDVLREINFSLRQGDFLGVVGPNAAGKTTFLRSMFGLVTPRSGELVLHQRGLRFGYVPQRQDIDDAFPLTAGEVVAMGLFPERGMFRRVGRRGREKSCEGLERVGAPAVKDVPYRNLSGGQKQRVLIARALVRGAEVLLLDEPTHDMDIAGERAIMELIGRLHREEGLTVVMVSHLLNLVAQYAGLIAIISSGRFVAGRNEEIMNAERLGRLYHVPVKVREVSGRRIVTV